ncbi:MAG: TetR/AcrR family transcriptional regulator [Candidatus Eisenbacteria bacterium]|uniref:TetR/AcrR family transcriptional regulator n=1 Tax=Eiseniibacteriota bacterium TaxID=2212470 RepID=A0A933SA90_UNCEI|nr:TetR/AcrR family transcriptional regulator [Candidatus Eisenbacteria bacterium]
MTSTHTPQTEPRWHRRKEARPAEILEAALVEFGSKGFAKTRLDDIAARAGCTKGTIFLYFANKEELLLAIARQYVLPRLEKAEQIVEAHQGTMRELLVVLLRTRWDAIACSNISMLPKLIFSEAANFPELARLYHDEIIARSHGLIERVLREGVARGEFREMDVANVARAAVAPILMAALWKHSFAPHLENGHEIAPFFETSLDLLLRGIARTDSTGGEA